MAIFNKSNLLGLSRSLMYFDVVLLIGYLLFRSEVLATLMTFFANTLGRFGLDQYRYLVWGLLLFMVCAACSFFRQSRDEVRLQKGIVFFELMVLTAFALQFGKSILQPVSVDPQWLLNLSIPSYLFEVVTTAGAGYLFSDFVRRIRFSVKKD